jgi:peptidoglycan/xylan/chitin deacetylase (PgdA/CDA1 family)
MRVPLVQIVLQEKIENHERRDPCLGNHPVIGFPCLGENLRYSKLLPSNAKTILKGLVAAVFFYSGLFHLTRLLNNLTGRRLTIVTYHRFTDKRLDEIEFSLPFLFVNEDTFIKQVRFFKKYYKVISFNDLEGYRREGRLPWKSLIITFDDGYEDNFLRAYPILKQHDVPSIIFVATSMVGGKEIPWWDQVYFRLNVLCDREVARDSGSQTLSDQLRIILEKFRKNPSELFSELNTWEQTKIDRLLKSLKTAYSSPEESLLSQNKFLSWEQATEMRGDIEFGSHTCSHIVLDGLPSDKIHSELSKSKKTLEERLGGKVNAFSYPAGFYTENTKNLVAECGYDFAVTQENGLNDMNDRFALKRINIWEGTASVWGRFSNALFALRLTGN